jgi:exosome complex component RRP46
LCAVYGPIAPKILQREDPYKAVVSVVFQEGREWEEFLQTILSGAIDCEQYPRTVVEVVIQVIQEDGSLLGCSLHAAVAALLDAGVALKYLPVATTCLVTGTELKLDPIAEEEDCGGGDDLAVAVVVNDNLHPDKVLGCESLGGAMSLESLLSCQEAATRASPAVVAFWRLAVEQKLTRQSQTLWST